VSFRGRTIVVTGGGSGIGRATALALARSGACAHVVDVAAAEDTAAQDPGEGSLIGHAMDVRDATSMIAGGGGSIVCTSSATAVGGTTGLAAYASSKGAVISLARQAAVEYAGAGVRVNVVAPGVIDTPLVANAPRRFIESVRRSTPMGRVGTPEEVAAAIRFLISDEAGFITGHVLAVDGGLLAQAVTPFDATLDAPVGAGGHGGA
jgi:3-oxoacyl-[acyl-carrier protein] reductase